MNSDNLYGECCKCPAKMNDSRLFTNYLLNSKLVTFIKKVNGIKSDHEFRLFMQQNASKIIEKEREFFLTEKRCNFEPYDSLFKTEPNRYAELEAWKNSV
tara:strand:- start:68 stop:367 length:300 start_codon:yes stop_codon:yes gene_type:complete